LLLSILCLNVMQFTNSAGALLVFVTLITILLTTTFLKKLNFTQSFIFFILLLFLFGITSIWLIENFENLLSFLNKDITLTGRLPLWTMLIQMRIKERLWLGYGYNAFWQRWRGNDSPAADVVNVIIGDGRDWVAHAHNGYLDIILNIGLIGLVIFVILFFINVIQTIRLIMSNKSPETFLPLIILTFVFMTNLSNSPIIIPSFIWFLFVTITIRLNLVSPKMVS
ncbi:MAG: O-antigen ligase family protein, partial [Waterburya sp.]